MTTTYRRGIAKFLVLTLCFAFAAPLSAFAAPSDIHTITFDLNGGQVLATPSPNIASPRPSVTPSPSVAPSPSDEPSVSPDVGTDTESDTETNTDTDTDTNPSPSLVPLPLDEPSPSDEPSLLPSLDPDEDDDVDDPDEDVDLLSFDAFEETSGLLAADPSAVASPLPSGVIQLRFLEGQTPAASDLPLDGIHFERIGYDFQGWFTAKEGGDKITPGEWTVTKVTTLYAHWKIHNYALSFSTSGGLIYDAVPSTYQINDNIALPNPFRLGYSFVAWYDNAAFSGQSYAGQFTADEAKIRAKGDRVFYAKWTTALQYKVTFNTNGGVFASADGITQVKANSQYTRAFDVVSEPYTFPKPTRTGFTFGGWYIAPNYVQGSVTALPKGSVGDRVFYAKWTPATFTNTFNYNGGKRASDSKTSVSVKSVGGKAVFPAGTPSRKGYLFKGWYTAKTGGTKINVNTNVTAAKTYYARWSARTYTITYVGVKPGKHVGKVANYVAGTKKKLGTATRKKYKFEGWFTGEERTGTSITAVLATQVGNLTLYCKWVKK